MRTIGDIVGEMLTVHKQGRRVNLVKLKQTCAKRNGMMGIPKLTQIIQVSAETRAARRVLLTRCMVATRACQSSIRRSWCRCSRQSLCGQPRASQWWQASSAVSLCARSALSVLTWRMVPAVMSKPHRCPHIAMTGGVCVYCPGGPDSDFEYSTQSYTGESTTETTL